MNGERLNQILQQRPRLRPDVQWSLFADGSSPTWVARDPVSLEYFYFDNREKSIAQQLDGNRSLQQIVGLSHDTKLTPPWLLGLVARLENACLIVPRSTVRNATRLHQAQRSRRRRERLGRWLSPLAVRFKLFDPTPVLDLLAPLARIVFSRTFVIAWAIAVLLIATLVFARMLAQPQAINLGLLSVTTARAIALVAIYVCVKSMHELGHALACRRWGVECHEIGVLFLVFTPCLYCDTSDSWRLGNRWKRASIAAAGIYVELTLAALAAVVWLTTQDDSLPHLLAENVMLLCSLNTILVNANPLLRYDGYYILSDVWGVPNLHEQSREALRGLTKGWLSGRAEDSSHLDARAGLLAAYGAAAWCYRHFVVLMIAWVIWMLLDDLGIPLLGAGLVMLTLTSVIVSNVVSFVRWLKELIVQRSFRRARLAAFAGAVAALTYAFFLVPVPTFVGARSLATLEQRSPVYAEHAGVLSSVGRVGHPIQVGEPVVELEAPDLQLDRIAVAGELAYFNQRIEQLQTRLLDEDSAASELSTVAEQRGKAREQLALLDQESATLRNLSPQSGLLLAGTDFDQTPLTSAEDHHSLRPILDSRHVGCFVERGTLLGWIANRSEFKATAYVVEQDAELLRVGMPVRCRWDCEVAERIDGTIARISPEPIESLPNALLGDQVVLAERSSDGSLVPLQPHYAVELNLERTPATLVHNAAGNVYFATAPATAFQWLLRMFDRYVRPDL